MSVLILNTTGDKEKFENLFCENILEQLKIETKLLNVNGLALLNTTNICDGYSIVILVAHGTNNANLTTYLDLGFEKDQYIPEQISEILNSPTLLSQLLGHNSNRYVLFFCACSAVSAELLVSVIDDDNCIGTISSFEPIYDNEYIQIAKIINKLHSEITNETLSKDNVDLIIAESNMLKIYYYENKMRVIDNELETDSMERVIISLTSETILEETYVCYGHYYSIKHEQWPNKCRSILEIIRKDLELSTPNDMLQMRPNAIFIMMNPGSSYPMTGLFNIVDSKDISTMPIELVLAHPDKTQYQLMRIMEHAGWAHVRVLNLSDLIESKSGEFYELYKENERNTGSNIHSCFSAPRQEELGKKLCIDNPIFAAWGVNDTLDLLIANCLNSLNKHTKIKGVKKKKTENKYYHPYQQGNPMDQLEWLNRAISLLD